MKSVRSRSVPRFRSQQKDQTPPTLAACVQAWRKGWRHGQPLPAALRDHALKLVASGIQPGQAARTVGVTYESVRLWVRKAHADGTMSSVAAAAPPAPSPSVAQTPTLTPASQATSRAGGPCEPGAAAAQASSSDAPARDTAWGLSSVEQAAVLDLKRRHPSMGPAQLRVQLKRFKGWRLSVRAIGQLLKRHGFELVHVGSRPKDEELRRWEAPHRNAIWQMDFVVLRVGPEQVCVLLVIDDFSRYCVAHELMTEPTSEAVVDVLRRAIRQHGKCEAVYTDRGGPFLAWRNPSSLQHFLEDELIEHHVGPSYRPQGRGKVEALAGTIQRELWNVVHFESVDQARDRLASFMTWYNAGRAHMGIDGLTPADRYFGRWDEVKARVDALSRGRQLALAGTGSDRLTEEVPVSGGPVEVVRLIAIDGRLELRFLGHRVSLGPIQA